MDHFKDVRDALTHIPKFDAGKFLGKSLELTRGILKGLGTEYGDTTKARQLGELIDKLSQEQGTANIKMMISIANQLTPQLREQLKLSEDDMPLLETDSVKGLSLAVSRVIQFGSYGAKKAEDSPAKDVFDYATESAILLAEIGAENKLKQHVLSLGDLVLRNPGKTARQVRDLHEKLQTSQTLATKGLYVQVRRGKVIGAAKRTTN